MVGCSGESLGCLWCLGDCMWCVAMASAVLAFTETVMVIGAMTHVMVKVCASSTGSCGDYHDYLCVGLASMLSNRGGHSLCDVLVFDWS